MIVSETDSQSTSDVDDPYWVPDPGEDVESDMVISDSEDEQLDFSYSQRGNEIPLPTQIQEIDSQFDPQLDDAASEIFPLLSPETATMSVHATTSDNHKQKWDKRHACKYCGKLYMKIARHLEACHSTETDVEKAIQQPKNSEARRAAWSVVRNEGDYSHNYNVFKVKKGIILPKYSCIGQVVNMGKIQPSTCHANSAKPSTMRKS